jgi:hypothetical protein
MRITKANGRTNLTILGTDAALEIEPGAGTVRITLGLPLGGGVTFSAVLPWDDAQRLAGELSEAAERAFEDEEQRCE